MATSPLVWMRAIRDAVPKPSAVRLAVLWALALRMRAGGIGYCSTRQLADDVEVDRRTVLRHLRWARDNDFLVQTRRGHRIDENTVVASEWQLETPTQGDTAATLAGDPRWQTAAPKVTDDGGQGDTGVTPRGLLPEVFPPAARVAATNGKPSPTSGGWEAHRNEPNARRAIAALIRDRTLPFTIEQLLELAYALGNGDPWDGYLLRIKAATEQSFTGARDPTRVLHKRLGLA